MTPRMRKAQQKREKWAHLPLEPLNFFTTGTKGTGTPFPEMDDLRLLLEQRSARLKEMPQGELDARIGKVMHVRVPQQRGLRGWLRSLLFGRRCKVGCYACALQQEAARRERERCRREAEVRSGRWRP